MKILFVRLSSLGDVALATGVCAWLKKKQPDCEIHFLTKPAFSFIPQHCPSVDKTLYWEGKSSFLSFVNGLDKYDFVFDLQNKLRSRIFQLKYPLTYSCYKKQSLLRRCMVIHPLFRVKKNKHVVEKYAEVVRSCFDFDFPDIEDIRPQLKASPIGFQNNLSFLEDKKYIVIHPYASFKTKEWSEAHNLCNELKSQGFIPVIVGRGQLRKWPEGTVDLVNKTSGAELLYILSKAKVVVSTDSGPLHLSVGLSRPTLALFGSTIPEFGFAPVFKSTKLVEVKGLSCRPCHVHGRKECPKKHFRCMKDISIKQVCEQIESLIQGQ